MGGVGNLGSIVGVSGGYYCFHVCTWNTPSVSLDLPAFDDTSSLDYPLRRVVYPHGLLPG